MAQKKAPKKSTAAKKKTAVKASPKKKAPARKAAARPKPTSGKSVQKSPKKGPAPKRVRAEILESAAKPVECEIIEDVPAERLKPVAPKGAAKPVKVAGSAPVKVAKVEVLPPAADEEDDAPAPDADGPPVDTDWDPEHEFEAQHEKKKKKILKKVKQGALVPVDSKSLTTATDSITAYLNEIRRYPLLTKEQELELAKRYFETKDPVVAQALVTANLRFVVKVAAEYSKYGARLIDLIQEGNMGLMHAVRDFNPYKGVRLITYAVWWIRGYIQEYLLKQYSMVKIATTQNQKRLFYRLQKEKDLLDSMGETPDMKLIGERMGIPTEEVEQMANRLSGRDVSLNTPLDDSSSSSLMDLQRSADAGIDDQIAAQEEVSLLREKLEEMRDQLSDREKIILDERLLADEPLTLQEIGEKYGITREAVRQMEARLMKKIRDRYMASLAAATEEE